MALNTGHFNPRAQRGIRGKSRSRIMREAPVDGSRNKETGLIMIGGRQLFVHAVGRHRTD